ncbi:MAG: enoyl-CoA hydratase/isomerase family protein [Planctomycetota bacterium]
MSVSDTLLPIDVSADPRSEGVVTLTLTQGDAGEDRPVVVLDSHLLKAIDATLDHIEREHAFSMTGLVLASAAPRSFVAGANLKEIMDLDDAGLHEYLRFGAKVFGRFATMPVTTVAAINHAALGGGLELAMHCDILIGATPDSERPYPVGLPEAGLSICPGWGGTNLLPARMDAKTAIVRTATGRPMKADAAHEMGLLSELVDAGALLDRARELAKTPKDAARGGPISITDSETTRQALSAAGAELEDKDPERAVLACVEKGLESGFDGAVALERDELVRLRSTERGEAAIRAFFDKGKK